MSNISTAHDAIVTKALALFSSKTRVHNPYELTDNPELTLKDSWGLKIGSAAYEQNEFCNLTMSRTFTFILIRQFASTGISGSAFDSITKSLLEDQKTFLDNIYSPSELGVESSIDKIDIDSVTGIEFMQADQKKYLFCEVSANILISEPVI